MTQEKPEMQPWQVFNAARRALGANVVAKIFNRSIRAAHDWAQDPAYTEVRCKSPLELLYTLFERMADSGRGYAARSAIQYLESAIDPDVEIVGVIEPLPTIQEEILADYAAVAALQRAIDVGASGDDIRRLKRDAIDEIERTAAKYIKDRRHG